MAPLKKLVDSLAKIAAKANRGAASKNRQSAAVGVTGGHSANLRALWYNSQAMAKEASLFETHIRHKTKSSHEDG